LKLDKLYTEESRIDICNCSPKSLMSPIRPGVY